MSNGTGLTIGSTVGSVIPGLGTGIGATIGTVYDLFDGLFGSDMKADQRLGIERLQKWVTKEGITDQTYIQLGVDGSKKYSGTPNYWSWFAKYKNDWITFKEEQKRKDNLLGLGSGLNDILTNPNGTPNTLLYVGAGVGVIILFIMLKG